MTLQEVNLRLDASLIAHDLSGALLIVLTPLLTDQLKLVAGGGVEHETVPCEVADQDVDDAGEQNSKLDQNLQDQPRLVALHLGRPLFIGHQSHGVPHEPKKGQLEKHQEDLKQHDNHQASIQDVLRPPC